MRGCTSTPCQPCVIVPEPPDPSAQDAALSIVAPAAGPCYLLQAPECRVLPAAHQPGRPVGVRGQPHFCSRKGLRQGTWPVQAGAARRLAPGDGCSARCRRLHLCAVLPPRPVSHNSLLPDGVQIVAPSAIGMSGQLYVDGGVKVNYSLPRALDTSEVPGIVNDFAATAVAAVETAGFDGVEIHGGNGYLLQQFMATATNQRSDQYGGTLENRCRLLLEVLDAVAAKIGPERTAVKIQPGVTFSELIEPEPDVAALLDYLGPELERRQLAYVCCSSLNGEPYFRFQGLEQPNVSFDVFKRFRQNYKGTLMINGALTLEAAAAYVADGTADLASFGCAFISNANLSELVAAGFTTEQLNPGGFDTKTW